MAQNALSILLQTNTSLKDTLKEEWGYVIDNYMKSTISGMFKNTDLSGDPTAGVLQAKRFANATNKAYGTARAAHRADKVKAKPVTVEIDDDQEWLEEVEEKTCRCTALTALFLAERRVKKVQSRDILSGSFLIKAISQVKFSHSPAQQSRTSSKVLSKSLKSSKTIL